MHQPRSGRTREAASVDRRMENGGKLSILKSTIPDSIYNQPLPVFFVGFPPAWRGRA